MSTGHEQLLSMAREGKGKVDKSIRMPRGFGSVDFVFQRFLDRWKDEWRRRVVSQAGCDALAGEWQHSLRPFDDAAIHKAVYRVIENAVPPSLGSFVDVVEMVVAERKPVVINRDAGRQHLARIKSLVKQSEVKH